MERDPKKRLSAFEMLHHPWVTGETASTNIMIGSDQKLNRFRKVRDNFRLVIYRTHQLTSLMQFKTRLQTQFFADAVGWSDEAIAEETRRRTSLIERSFHAFDGSDLKMRKLLSNRKHGLLASELGLGLDNEPRNEVQEVDNRAEMTMSDYQDLLSENMKQKYFPKGHVIYNEGDTGRSSEFALSLHCTSSYAHVVTSVLH